MVTFVKDCLGQWRAVSSNGKDTYGVGENFCSCLGFKFRGYCKHITAFKEKGLKTELPKVEDIHLENGCEALKFVEKYGEETLQLLKIKGLVYENFGKIYKL